jgi:plastocyanin
MKQYCIACLSFLMLCLTTWGCKRTDCPNMTVTPTTEDIVMLNTVFSPAEKTITKGTTVRWKNEDPYAHTVTSDDNIFNSGNLNQGQMFEYTFNTAGTYHYHCIYHAPAMKGTITVN